MNFSEMSDFEINILVAQATGHKPLDPINGWKGMQEPPFTAAICKGPRILGGFDPCNTWGHSGPIIQHHKISLIWVKTEIPNRWDAGSPCHMKWAKHETNPLRAAMEVFLMMQDGA